MAAIRFAFLNPADCSAYADRLFEILAGNMRKIAPTGASYEEDYAIWLPAFTPQLQQEKSRVVLIFDDDTVIGYFQYRIENDTFFMEEIQLVPSHQGRYGIFRALYGFVIAELPDTVTKVRARAAKSNAKSIAILTRLGLSVIGENKTGRSYILEGSYADLLKWYRSKTA